MSSRSVASLASAVLYSVAAVVLMSAPRPAAADEAVDALIAELGLREGDVPARELPRWRVPRKIVMIGGGGPDLMAAMRELAPAASVVVVGSSAAAVSAAADADVIIGTTRYPGICEPEIIDNARELRWIFSMSAGVERCVAIPSIKERGIVLTNLRAVESAAIAEHAIAMTMALARDLDGFMVSQQQARWARGTGSMQVLNGKTLLVVGLGGIGTEVAKRGHGIGMRVIATRNSSREGPDYVSYVGLPDELFKLAADADVVINAAPLTSATRGLFDAKFFAVLKPSAFFVNVARGGSVVTADLIAALNSGRLAGAGLDAIDPEPLPADHPLWRARNVIITPHISGGSDLPGEERWIVTRENLRRYVAGEKLLSVVDLEREY